MKIKILKIVIPVMIMILLISIFIVAYFFIADIETDIPKKVEEECNLEINYFMERKIFTLSPKNGKKSDLVILYFHGGSYVAEASTQHWEFIEKLAVDTNSTIIVPDYPLAPKYNYKDVFKMVIPLYKEIIERVDSNNLLLMGDSAGGGLSLALYEKLSQDNITLPKKNILISPWLDVRLENDKIDDIEKYDNELNRKNLKLAGIAYASDDRNG